MNITLHCLYLILLLHTCSGVIYRLNDTEYERMPPIFQIDDYNSCLQGPSDVYCTLIFNLVSDEPSELLNTIEQYSEHYHTHFNHMRISYGLCVKPMCQKYIDDKFPVPKPALEGCLNETFFEKYQLKTNLLYHACYSVSDNGIKVDESDKMVAIILLGILLLNIIGTLYDVCKAKNDPEDDHFLLMFSIKRNWRKLTSKRSLEPRSQSLKGLDGLRCILVCGVLLVHCIYPFVMAGENVHELELAYSEFFLQFILNTPQMMQAFFVISGFLLVYNLQIYSEKHSVTWSMVPRAIINRYLRLTPAYVFVISILATWLKFVGPGMVWELTGHAMLLDCRSRWWMNFLYINNYAYNTQCLPTTWSMAVEMQLFCLGVTIFVLLRNTRFRKVILFSLSALGVVLVGIQTYVRDINATLSFAPGIANVVFSDDPTFNETYKMGHCNLSSYVIGLSLGYCIYKCQQKKIDVTKYSKYRYQYWAVIPLTACVWMSGSYFTRFAPRDPAHIRALYAAFSKPTIAILVAILIAGIVLKFENVYRKFFELDIWSVPSKLTYCVYLIHLHYITIYMSLQTSLQRYTPLNMIIFTIGVTTASFLTAIPMFLLIEAPFTEVARRLTNRASTYKQKKIN